jgi:hypothetical protein
MFMKCRVALMTAAVLFWAGCSNNDESVDTTDYAAAFVSSWQVSSGGNGLKYIIFQTDRVGHMLGQDAHGFRAIVSGAFSATSDVVTVAGSSYLYAMSGDQLSLAGTNDTITLSRTSMAPTLAQWVRPVTPEDSIASPVQQAVDIACDSTRLWIGGGVSAMPVLYSVDLTTRTPSFITPTVLVTAAEWTGSALWCSGAFISTLANVNPANGALIATSPTIGGSITGLSWDGQLLWAGSQTAGNLIGYDPSLNAVTQSITGITGDGMAFAQGFLYFCKNGLIHKCTMSPFQATTSYTLPGGLRSFGIAYDGTRFWVLAATNSSPATYTIYRVTL